MENASHCRCSTSVEGWGEGAQKSLGGARRDEEGGSKVTLRGRRS